MNIQRIDKSGVNISEKPVLGNLFGPSKIVNPFAVDDLGIAKSTPNIFGNKPKPVSESIEYLFGIKPSANTPKQTWSYLYSKHLILSCYINKFLFTKIIFHNIVIF